MSEIGEKIIEKTTKKMKTYQKKSKQITISPNSADSFNLVTIDFIQEREPSYGLFVATILATLQPLMVDTSIAITKSNSQR